MLVGRIILIILGGVSALSSSNETKLAAEYFDVKDVRFVCYLSCESQFHNKQLASEFHKRHIRVSIRTIAVGEVDLTNTLLQWTVPVGVLLHGVCGNAKTMLEQASTLGLFDSMHAWLVLQPQKSTSNVSSDGGTWQNETFEELHLSVNTDLVVAADHGTHYELTDIFNFGKIQGNPLEKQYLGTWDFNNGLQASLKGFKYYDRWDFHNLTLRAISVVVGGSGSFTPSMLSDASYSPGVSAMTKTTAIILDVIREQHNFRFKYTIADRWVGTPQRNSTLAVTNSLYWREQDVSVTCLRIFSSWLDWMDPLFPPTTYIETKFYYLIPEVGVGEYENRFGQPLAGAAWAAGAAACCACGVLLWAAARAERHPEPVLYALLCVLAAACQQSYEDGVKFLDKTISSQGRRLILFVLGMTSMLVYNYYTSSVVSWLLNAAAPTIASMDALTRSDLELVFEDIGYTRSWLDGPGFYYYSGFKLDQEDRLREVKVKNSKRTVPLLQPVSTGIQLIRTGKYAYHTEPYSAEQVLGPRLSQRELCELGALQVMPPAPVYVVGQRRGPYRQFFVWSLLRATERGHVSVARRRVERETARCAGRTPRALSLGQAAPAALMLLGGTTLAGLVLAVECLLRYKE